MLRGRESLRRIIGKRRRFLPNLSRIISASSSPTLSTSLEDGNHKLSIEDSAIPMAESKLVDDNSEVVISENNFVICPVCSNQIRGDDHSVNSHIGESNSRLKFVKLSPFFIFNEMI